MKSGKAKRKNTARERSALKSPAKIGLELLESCGDMPLKEFVSEIEKRKKGRINKVWLIFDIVHCPNSGIEVILRPLKEKPKASPLEFINIAAKELQAPGGSWINSIDSGFFIAFREYFPDLDPLRELLKARDAGIIMAKKLDGALHFRGR